jgi:NADH-quinone oxidoreductase subunit A
MKDSLLPLAVYLAVVSILVAAMLGISALLGEKHDQPATGEPYESGIVSTGSARIRMSAHFYVVAMLFVIFDLEAVFLFAWAVAARRVGWAGYGGMLVFVAILVAGLVYEWRQGALDTAGAARRPRALPSARGGSS